MKWRWFKNYVGIFWETIFSSAMIHSEKALLFFRGLKVLLHLGAHYVENTFLNDGMSDLSEKIKKSVINA